MLLKGELSGLGKRHTIIVCIMFASVMFESIDYLEDKAQMFAGVVCRAPSYTEHILQLLF